MLYRFIALVILLSLQGNAFAATIKVTEDDDLQRILDAAVNGDQIILSDGEYNGNFIIRHSITLQGSSRAVLNANGKGHGLLLKSDNIQIIGVKIGNWGHNLTEENAA
ncbi:TPA: copper-binding protein, partial [Vibrio vulnificus]